MLGLASIQGRKGLSKSPRLPTFAQHCLKASQSISRSVVMTTIVKVVVLFHWSHVSQGFYSIYYLTFISHFTASGVYHTSSIWAWSLGGITQLGEFQYFLF